MCGTMIPTNAISPLTDDRRGRPERRRDDDRQPRPRDVDPEARGLVVAEAEDVEHAPMQDEHERAHRDVRRADRDVVPGRGREAAEQPASRRSAAAACAAAARTSAPRR